MSKDKRIPKVDRAAITEAHLPGPGALRQRIQRVCYAVDAQGRRLSKYAVLVGGAWALLDVKKMVGGQIDELVDLATRNDLPVDLSKSQLIELGAQLGSRVAGSVLCLDSSGYQVIQNGDEEIQALIWRGKAHWVGDAEPPEVAIVAGADAGRGEPDSARGSLKAWNRLIGKHFSGNPYMIVALGAALSALLVRPLNLQPLMLVLVGRSSIGKTAVQSAVQSIIRMGLPDTASGTVLGHQQNLSEQADQPVFLQDTRQFSNLAQLVNLVFDHGNKTSRVVGQQSQSALRGNAMRCVLIASNERKIADLVRGRDAHLDAGLDARVLELIIDGPHGAFHDLPEGMDGAEFAEHLTRQSSLVFGAVWDAWVSLVAENLVDIRERAATTLPKIRALLESKADVEDPVSRRMVNGYAGWLFALSFACKHELFPLTVVEIKNAFVLVLKEHMERRVQGRTPTEEEIIKVVRAAIDENRRRFVDLGSEDHQRDGLWGYRHAVKGKMYYLFLPSAFARMTKSYGHDDVLSTLKSAQFLRHNKDELMYTVRMPGGEGSKRFYAVSEAIRFDG